MWYKIIPSFVVVFVVVPLSDRDDIRISKRKENKNKNEMMRKQNRTSSTGIRIIANLINLFIYLFVYNLYVKVNFSSKLYSKKKLG